MITCKEASRKIASSGLAESGWRERIAIRLHLLMCSVCRRYATQLRVIGAVSRHLCAPQTQDPSALARLERQILERTRKPKKDA